jgi:hypothetical protein
MAMVHASSSILAFSPFAGKEFSGTTACHCHPILPSPRSHVIMV